MARSGKQTGRLFAQTQGVPSFSVRPRAVLTMTRRTL
jgi:hypothetical protein